MLTCLSYYNCNHAFIVILTYSYSCMLIAKVALCPNLNLTNGEVVYDSATIPGKIAIHSCNNGYTLSGGASRACTPRGWDGNDITCEGELVCL